MLTLLAATLFLSRSRAAANSLADFGKGCLVEAERKASLEPDKQRRALELAEIAEGWVNVDPKKAGSLYDRVWSLGDREEAAIGWERVDEVRAQVLLATIKDRERRGYVQDMFVREIAKKDLPRAIGLLDRMGDRENYVTQVAYDLMRDDLNLTIKLVQGVNGISQDSVFRAMAENLKDADQRAKVLALIKTQTERELAEATIVTRYCADSPEALEKAGLSLTDPETKIQVLCPAVYGYQRLNLPHARVLAGQVADLIASLPEDKRIFSSRESLWQLVGTGSHKVLQLAEAFTKSAVKSRPVKSLAGFAPDDRVAAAGMWAQVDLPRADALLACTPSSQGRVISLNYTDLGVWTSAGYSQYLCALATKNPRRAADLCEKMATAVPKGWGDKTYVRSAAVARIILDNYVRYPAQTQVFADSVVPGGHNFLDRVHWAAEIHSKPAEALRLLPKFGSEIWFFSYDQAHVGSDAAETLCRTDIKAALKIAELCDYWKYTTIVEMGAMTHSDSDRIYIFQQGKKMAEAEKDSGAASFGLSELAEGALKLAAKG
ncbi:MAG TPA: hypothetical protein VGL56_19755 [Fimbriimonadaceae bacterium]|jgi:hypothetical protein